MGAESATKFVSVAEVGAIYTINPKSRLCVVPQKSRFRADSGYKCHVCASALECKRHVCVAKHKGDV